MSFRGGRRPTWQSRSTRLHRGKVTGEIATAFPRLPRLLRSLAMTNLAACCIRRDAVTSLQAPSSRVIAGREAPSALPLGEMSPKVTERALQALPISSGRCSNGTHLRLVIARRGRKPDAAISGRQQRICRGLSRVPDGTARLPRLLRSLAMTSQEACRIRRGAMTKPGALPSRVIARRA